MAMEHERYAANVGDDSATSQFYTFTESQYYTSIAEPVPNNAPRNARSFPKVLKEYQSEDIKNLVNPDEPTIIGAGGQAVILEVIVDTGIEHGGRNPKYHTYVAKLFSGRPEDSHYGQWEERVHGLADFYGGFICQFYGYCRNYKASKKAYEKLDKKLKEELKANLSFSSEEGSFCLLMRKYDCSLRNIIDEEMRKNNNSGRPFIPGVAVNMICQIAAGMAIVHKNNIIHRDLKADNVFVYKDADDNMPWAAYIGDFDLSDATEGTRYWRAPEILEAVHQREKRPWTPMADVYSFGMTCYEILTGGIPLENLRKTDYESVYKAATRPELPEDLNPKIKKVIVSCWHQDPHQRPTFDAILSELVATLHEFPEFLKMFDKIQLPPSTEQCISRLEHIFQDFRSKYPVNLFARRDEEDFVKVGIHFVKCMKRFVRKFGYKPYIDHPSLPWSLYYARSKWIEKLWRLSVEMDHALPYFDERMVITKLKIYIFEAICEGQKDGNSWTEEEGVDENQKEAKWRSWLENVKRRPPLVDRHSGCIQKSNYGHYGGDKDYPICGFCKAKKQEVQNAQEPTFRLFPGWMACVCPQMWSKCETDRLMLHSH